MWGVNEDSTVAEGNLKRGSNFRLFFALSFPANGSVISKRCVD